MPLHLLGKKSWNVYNADNIARVRRDEAAAKAKEEAEEQRMQEIDAERRLAILRGEVPPPLPLVEAAEDETRSRDRDAGPVGRERKKRKRAGEDDTEFELRVAKERADVIETANDTLRKSTSSAPIVDSDGHIDLFGEERKQGRHLKNEEAEKEAAEKKKELEDQYTMRFSNAAGKDGLVGPWYAASGAIAELEPPSKDAWGNEDPGRKKRDAERIVSNDPLAMMKRGASKVRQVKKERQDFEAERQRELEQLRNEERRKERRERWRRDQKRYEERHLRHRSRERGREEQRHRSRKDDDRRHVSSRDDERSRNDERRHRERSQRSERGVGDGKRRSTVTGDHDKATSQPESERRKRDSVPQPRDDDRQ
ncbi:hypothetical protein CTA2_12774 [Colletotrichum tanaceti]|uniref:CBF1-interacting co-repressor CIR N-terminal domain-containing protein n=1 Tax=Colletotrichum tanaceti TaxID=1306861 RepID=A0A4U6XQD7_9PEZI|nr:hypothetical protein CTA2_12774 [Colletotrichum tanaceti]TKW58040.1 hypothetical protein CTA1_790 [Colletotrichum tanaceti]